MTPFTAVAAEASFDGSLGFGCWRVDRDAADRAAFFFRAVRVLVLGVGRLFVDFLAARFAAGFRFGAVRFFPTARFVAAFRFAVRCFATPPPERHP
jgi:hypothetical protein